MGWNRIGEGPFFERSGEVGKGGSTPFAIIVGIRHAHNDIGTSFFGGSKRWPCVTARIDLPGGAYQQAEALVEKIKALIDQELPE